MSTRKEKDAADVATAAASDVENPSYAPNDGGLSNETVTREVLWQREHRSYTDKWWGLVYVLSYVAFIGCGITLAVQSNARYESLEADGPSYVSKHFQGDVVSCCQKIANKNSDSASDYYDLCDELPPDLMVEGTRRSLAEVGNSTFHGDEGIFDAFIMAPELIVGMISLTLVVALLWVILLRLFAKPIVILTELVKIGIFVFAGVVQEITSTRVLCFAIAVGIVLYDIWARKSILFAADIMSHSVVAFQANPIMFVALLLIQVLFVGNALLFVYFFSQSFDVAQVKEETVCYSSYFGNVDEQECYSQCVFAYPSYISGVSVYMSLSYLWTICLFHKMRLSVIATLIGSWHFHPENKPSIFTALSNTCTTSFGTLSVSALISTIAERIQRMATEPCWKTWLGPAVCVTAPLQLILCIFGSCLSLILKMLTKFAVIMHVWTGLPFIGSAKKVFAVMSRHFKNGFVTEVTSQSVLMLASYVFSLCIGLLTWVWFDDRFNTSTIPGGGDASYYILFVLAGLFTTWYPVLGLYVIILIDRLLRQIEYQHLWVAPLAALFVSCLAMMFFTYVASIFLDTIDVLFLCFAVDRDHQVTPNAELAKLMESVPAFVEIIEEGDKTDPPQPAGATVVAVPVGTAPAEASRKD